MEDKDIERIYRGYRRRLKETSLSFTRFLYDKINWNDKLIGIKGARGVGKTTLILQYIKRNFEQTDRALYISLDNLWFSTHSLDDLIEYHYTHGGTHLFLDEVHKYPRWQTMLKNVNDEYSDLHIVYTGSSMLEIDVQQGDLSRRQMVYNLVGLSFREFLEFECDMNIPAYSLEELLQDHVAIASVATERMKIGRAHV